MAFQLVENLGVVCNSQTFKKCSFVPLTEQMMRKHFPVNYGQYINICFNDVNSFLSKNVVPGA